MTTTTNNSIDHRLDTERKVVDEAVMRFSSEWTAKEQAHQHHIKECEVLESQIKTITRNLDALRIEEQQRRQRKETLEVQLSELLGEIEELNASMRNTDSLYKLYSPLPHSNTLELRMQGYMLTASHRTKLKFPVDLVIALQQDKTPGKTIPGNATCFIFIKKEDWSDKGVNKWQTDLSGRLTTAGLKKGIYLAEFTQLHFADYTFKIDFTSKKIAIN